jgi:hypothetical protein
MSEPPQARRGVEVCERPVEGAEALSDATGIQHWFLRTTRREGGMGERGQGVPGQGGKSFPLGIDTTINDHAGQGVKPNATCYPVPDVDEDCVDRHLEPGRGTGAWVPPFNDCHTVVRDILDDCRQPPPSPADAGAPRR